MPKLVDRFIGKGKKKQEPIKLPLPGASRSQEIISSLPLDDTVRTFPDIASAANIPKQNIGLFELSTNECEKKIDVVAVHGLQGDAYKTWEHDNGSLWLRDFLPADIPSARIMTFGYDSTVAFSKSVAKIEDKALELLNHLSAKRSPVAPGGPSKPIVFICHSLGGIVVKKALITAHERSSNADYKDILVHTKGIAFLGVPHQGSDIAWWAGFAAKLLRNASIGTSTNVALLSDLEKGSTTLANISNQFVDRASNLIIYTFYETEKLNKVMVVDKQSAIIGRLPNESEFPVNANHRTICKIPSSTSHEYKTVGFWTAKLAHRVLDNAFSHGKMLAETQTPSYYEVPNRRVRQFVGREDILQRIDRALSTGPSPRTAVLQGMGGQGKSQIALEYCHRKKDILYSAIFWINATTEDSVKGCYQAISEQIKKPTDPLPDIHARVAFVLRIFCSWPTRWLLVFDNYDNPRAFPNIADFIPQSKLGAILVTSRHAESDSLVLGQKNHFIKLQGLEEGPAILLLSQRSQTKEDLNDENAREIVERLGYHPLAITQAGAYIKRRGLQLCDFMKVYKEQREAILKNTPPLSQYRRKLGDAEKETSLNVFTTWELSFQRLQSQASANDVETKLLTLFAFFDNKDISEQLFAEYNADTEGKFESAKLLTWLDGFTNAKGEWDNGSFAEVLITLRDLSLLQGFAQGLDGFYHSSLHPLIKDWIRLRTNKSVGQENIYMSARLISKMLSNSWRKYTFELSLSAKQDILLHIVALEEAHGEFFVSKMEIPANKDIFKEYLLSQSWFAEYLLEIGSYQLAVIISQRIVAQREECFGLEHPSTLDSAANLASIYRNQGRWKEAEELGKQVMEKRKRVLGLENPDTLTSTANLASTYFNQGRLKEAEELNLQVVETSKRVLGLEHPSTLTGIGNLALTLRTQGRWKEAEELYVQVVETIKRVLGHEHPDTLTSTANLASTYFRQGRLKEAEELNVQVMEKRKRVQGLEHPDTLISTTNLASTHFNQGRLKEAEELNVQAMETSKRVLGLEHPITLTCMANLAFNFWGRNQKKQAIELLNEVIQCRRAKIGPDHPNTISSMHTLQKWQDELE